MHTLDVVLSHYISKQEVMLTLTVADPRGGHSDPAPWPKNECHNRFVTPPPPPRLKCVIFAVCRAHIMGINYVAKAHRNTQFLCLSLI